MKDLQTVSRVTACLHSNISQEVFSTLKDAGIQDFYLFSARSPVIEAKKRFFPVLPGRNLVQDPLDTIFCLVKPEMTDKLLQLIVENGHLHSPGRGSVLAETVTVLDSHELCRENDCRLPENNPLPVHLYPLTGICCIIKRGLGDLIARIALDTGICVPVIHFGTGTGIRDKMGLLRITIPAEKEIVQAFAPAHEAGAIMEMMIDAGRLDQPGNGFIHTFPIDRALVNMRIMRGEQRHAASIEQIITALDHIRGNTDWRRRKAVTIKKQDLKKRYITNLSKLSLLCDAGTGTGLVNAAMAAGSGGATLFNVKHVRPSDSPLSGISPAREVCSMGVPENIEAAVVSALKAAGAFTDQCHGLLLRRQIPRAFTYVAA
jgi:hypothetical protein